MTWSIHIIEVGALPGCTLASYVEGASEEGFFEAPCYCWLLRDGSQSILVDTGPDATAPAEYAVAGDTHAALLAGLRAAEVEPTDIGLIVHTHLHQDHVQNDHLFPRSKVIVQSSELRLARAGEAACAGLSGAQRTALAAAPYATSQAAGIWYVGTRDLEESWGSRAATVDGDEQVLPGVRVVLTGGHTDGHQSVLVNTVEGTVCIAGDIVSLGVNVTKIGPMTPDADAARAFLTRAAAGGWLVMPSHEPSLRTHRWNVASPS